MPKPMNRSMAAWLVAAAVVVATPAAVLAQTQTAVAADSLYLALGGRAGVAALAADLTRRLAVDPRTTAFFKDLDLARFESQMVTQICEMSDGGCRYTGKDMKTVHSGVDITKADFNAVVEILQESMDAQRIAFTVQNRLLARLAPMHREIINAPSEMAAAGPAAPRATP